MASSVLLPMSRTLSKSLHKAIHRNQPLHEKQSFWKISDQMQF
uniref:Uncharacterized protein n=1 Tax=Anguilla anguilla TaxID=7936 RepID=A0A0E9QL80_ANGAN